MILDIARTELLKSISSALAEGPEHQAYKFDRVFWVTAQDPVSLCRSFPVIKEALLRWTGHQRGDNAITVPGRTQRRIDTSVLAGIATQPAVGAPFVTCTKNALPPPGTRCAFTPITKE